MLSEVTIHPVIATLVLISVFVLGAVFMFSVLLASSRNKRGRALVGFAGRLDVIEGRITDQVRAINKLSRLIENNSKPAVAQEQTKVIVTPIKPVQGNDELMHWQVIPGPNGPDDMGDRYNTTQISASGEK